MPTIDPIDHIKRECVKISQRQFAKKIGISPQMLSDVVNGYSNPGEKLLGALGYSSKEIDKLLKRYAKKQHKTAIEFTADEQAVVDQLRAEANETSMCAVARRLKVSPQLISSILADRPLRRPSDKILEGLGMRKVVKFEVAR